MTYGYRACSDPRARRTERDVRRYIPGQLRCPRAQPAAGWLIAGSPVDGVSVQILCYWDLIKWSFDRGLALDLGGAPNEGIRELKTSLGADLETAVRALQFRPAAAYKAAAALRNWGPVRANWERMRRMVGD